VNSEPILIVGAGAVGLTVGHHLSLAGADVTYFIRPGRRDSFPTEHSLYCYDDATLETHAGYRVVSTAAEVAAQRYDYVLLTLDAATCRSEPGNQLLRELGDALRDTPATVIYCGVGLGLREHLTAVTHLHPDRLLEGSLGSLSHQTEANLANHPPTDPAILADSAIAYRHFAGRVGFVLVPEPRDAAKRFARIYNRNGTSRSMLVPAAAWRIYSNIFFCYTLTLELAGWPDTAELTRNPDALALCTAAMRDILTLAQFGLTGRIARCLLTPGLWSRNVRTLERRALPLDWAAFNRFHHGGKVLAQDTAVVRYCQHEGYRQNRPMRHLTQLIEQFDHR
jgi:Ketopantoate reductase PanE/ApbA